MARAEQVTEIERKVIETEVSAINLQLTLPEARTLRFLMTLIGGPMDTSPRKHTANIGAALNSAGVPWLCDSNDICQLPHRAIYFKANTLDVME